MKKHEIIETAGGGALGESLGGNRRRVTIIRAGWGSSGYYPEEVLARDVPRVFGPGTHMYLDHPTTKEAAERPERSVRDLVGTITETPKMAGIDAVSVAEVFSHWQPVVNELAPHIGLSIRAFGEVEEGDAAGKHGNIVQALTEGVSVDYVTKAGAGGKIGDLIESARQVDAQMPDPELVEAAGEIEGAWRESGWIPHEIIEASNAYEAYQSFTERTISKEERVRLAKRGQAIPVKDNDGNVVNGRFPMANCEDVKAAAMSIGRADSEEAGKIKSFIKRVASKLDCPVPFEESGSGRQRKKEGDPMDPEKALSEAQDEIRQLETQVQEEKDRADKATTRADRAEDKLRLNEAGAIVAKVVSEVEGLPKRAKARAIESALRGDLPTDSEGRLDHDALKERAKSKAQEEKDYLGEASGGRVEGFGESTEPGNGGGNGDGGEGDELAEVLQNSLGLPKEVAQHAAEGR